MITTGKRGGLAAQSFNSLIKNASDWSKHTITIVVDSDGHPDYRKVCSRIATMIINCTQQGASASRNIGASSIPKYRRQSHVMFIDDDCYFTKWWDARIEEALALDSKMIVGAYAHPYNHGLGEYEIDGVRLEAAGVLSTVAMAMDWSVFDECGPWDEPGGSGGSEDVAFCARAVKAGYGLSVVSPHAVIHAGLHSSSGAPIVGIELLQQQNLKLEQAYGITGDVLYG